MTTDDAALTLFDALPAAGAMAREHSVPVEGDARVVAKRLGVELDDVLLLAMAFVGARLTGVPSVTAASERRGALNLEVSDAAKLDDWAKRAIASTVEAATSNDWIVDIQDREITNSPWRLHLAWRGDHAIVLRAPETLPRAAFAVIEAALREVLVGLADEQCDDLAKLSLLDQRSRTLQLREWNDTARPRRAEDSVPALFAAIAQRHPESIAVIDGTQRLSYGELDRASNALANALLDDGLQAGELVGVLLPRSADAVIALLGILKAGGAYLPLDASFPRERLSFMLDDARVTRAIAASTDAVAALPGKRRAILLATTQDSSPRALARDGASLAYVMYTSGSTGTPKGVCIPDRAIIRLVRDVDYVTLDRDTRLLHAAPLGFDASTLEIWGALLNGGTVVVHEETLPSGQGLTRTISAHGVTTAWLTAALFNAIVEQEPRHLAGLRELLTGGEALSVEHIRRARAALPDTALINGYGPTECTTFTCTHRIATVPDDATSIPIGKPIADTRVFVLNARRELLPIGAVGELYVAGEGLALGYLGQAALTAERFVDVTIDGRLERCYRTGDRVRWLADGTIDFLGRADTQVKIRGYRIETGEIENALARHPAVRACAVIARDDRPGGKYLAAYCVLARDVAMADLREHLAQALPEFMVPHVYVRLDALPVTANGKLDRRALPTPSRTRPELAVAFAPAKSPDEERLCALFARVLEIDRVGREDSFFALGGNSLLALRLIAIANREGLVAITATRFYRDPTPAALAQLLSQGEASALEASRLAQPLARADEHEPIAIVAMAGRFPGASDVETFWRNLCEGVDSITRFAPEEIDPSIPTTERDDPRYVRARGVIDGVETFDASFFGISPREAELIDPQQRIFLELCWEALERAGHVPDAAEVPIGIFAGMYNGTYFQRHVQAYPELIDKLGAFQVMLGNEKDYIATRVAHKLNLTGPAISVHTACSTSLVAVCQAVDALRAGRCDMALAGGASVTCPPRSGYLYQEGAMLSPDGHTRSFDAAAGGTVFSDGAAVLVLKRLSDARRDGNPLIALIRGGAVNNDGGIKASFTAPSSAGQAAVIAMAQRAAGVDARSISYIEAHGTATPVGDPIEIEGLTQAFQQHTRDTGFCRIGSVKSNVGHLVIAAGATGLIKTALSLRDERIPASLHFERANDAIDFARSPFVVNDRLTPWPRGAQPRRAGVSAFGVGGTNAHVIVEEAPLEAPTERSHSPRVLTLSARTPEALAQATERLADHLEAQADISLDDVAWTLAIGRKAFAHRLSVVADTPQSAVTALREAQASAARTRPARGGDLVMMFPGQGATYPAMGRALYREEPVFRGALDEVFDAIASDTDLDLRHALFDESPEALLPTARMQPATFALEYALARWWQAQGVTPAALIGHSVGEFVAATLAGVFEVTDAARLVALRGRLMQAMPAGAMLSVRLPTEAVLARLPDTLSLAAENAPGACVVAGPIEAITDWQRALESEGIACRTLRTSHAFHSSMMDPVIAPFRAAVARVTLRAPRIPIVSTATGDWLDEARATSPDYWASHLREPVRFSTALRHLLDAPARTLLEVGPRATLTTLARQHLGAQAAQVACVASLADDATKEVTALRGAFGQLWCRGLPVRPASLDRRARRARLCLPTYPFERQRHWLEARVAATPTAPIATALSSAVPEIVMPPAVTSRQPRLLAQLKSVFEDVTGVDLGDADPAASFLELGLDSLMLTQVATQVHKQFGTPVTFRQLMVDFASLDKLVTHLDASLPAESAPVAAPAPIAMPAPMTFAPIASAAPANYVQQVIQQQMQIMAQQLALLGGQAAAMPAMTPVAASTVPAPTPVATTATPTPTSTEEESLAHTRYDVKKAFGAIARIHSGALELDARQRDKLDTFITQYVARTRKSKDYTTQHRDRLADPRVVNGFRPLLKEIIYQIVIERSRGAHLWDLDGHRYVDALNGFGMSLFGWQPPFVLEAVRNQLDLGYEIGPQHPLAGEVAELVCELTGHDRAGLCNTGSEAVMGCLRIARTVTGRERIAIFSGAYHGIFDEVIVRGTKKLRAVPAAPGIMRNTAENVVVLDYGTPESLAWIREHAHELAAVLIEPVQSRRPDFQPREFLHEVRRITREAGTLFVFDEVVTGFRAHPRGAQAVFDIDVDLASYGKVVGGGFPIGVIAGKREYMDALDGGHWRFGDDSVPTVGVTYFAGTFVRHPLALAAAKAVLLHMKAEGPGLQERLNARTARLADTLNTFCADVGAPIAVKHFASVWKTQFTEDHPLQDLLFAMMRLRGIHILDNFPCFFTTAHAEEDFVAIETAFQESVLALQDAGFLPRSAANARTVMDATQPPVPGARLGREPDGRPAWYVPHPDQPGQFLKVGG